MFGTGVIEKARFDTKGGLMKPKRLERKPSDQLVLAHGGIPKAAMDASVPTGGDAGEVMGSLNLD